MTNKKIPQITQAEDYLDTEREMKMLIFRDKSVLFINDNNKKPMLFDSLYDAYDYCTTEGFDEEIEYIKSIANFSK